jgi:hypothetical protein
VAAVSRSVLATVVLVLFLLRPLPGVPPTFAGLIEFALICIWSLRARRPSCIRTPSRAFYSLVTACGASKSASRAYVKIYDGHHLMGVNMGEVVRFVPKSERERIRLIREAGAIYESVFPPAAPVNEQSDKTPVAHTIRGANPHRSDGVLS